MFNRPYNFNKNIIWLELFLAQVKKAKIQIFIKFNFFFKPTFYNRKKIEKEYFKSKSNKCLPYFFLFFLYAFVMYEQFGIGLIQKFVKLTSEAYN